MLQPPAETSVAAATAGLPRASRAAVAAAADFDRDIAHRQRRAEVDEGDARSASAAAVASGPAAATGATGAARGACRGTRRQALVRARAPLRAAASAATLAGSTGGSVRAGHASVDAVGDRPEARCAETWSAHRAGIAHGARRADCSTFARAAIHRGAGQTVDPFPPLTTWPMPPAPLVESGVPHPLLTEAPPNTIGPMHASVPLFPIVPPIAAFA